MNYLILALALFYAEGTEIREANYKDIPKIVVLIDQLGYQTTQEILGMLVMVYILQYTLVLILQ